MNNDALYFDTNWVMRKTIVTVLDTVYMPNKSIEQYNAFLKPLFGDQYFLCSRYKRTAEDVLREFSQEYDEEESSEYVSYAEKEIRKLKGESEEQELWADQEQPFSYSDLKILKEMFKTIGKEKKEFKRIEAIKPKRKLTKEQMVKICRLNLVDRFASKDIAIEFEISRGYCDKIIANFKKDPTMFWIQKTTHKKKDYFHEGSMAKVKEVLDEKRGKEVLHWKRLKKLSEKKFPHFAYVKMNYWRELIVKRFA